MAKVYNVLESHLKTSFDFVNCIQCQIYKPKAKTTHLLYLQKNPQSRVKNYSGNLNIRQVQFFKCWLMVFQLSKDILKFDQKSGFGYFLDTISDGISAVDRFSDIFCSISRHTANKQYIFGRHLAISLVLGVRHFKANVETTQF